MGTVGVRKLVGLAIDIHPCKRIDVQEADCYDCVDFPNQTVKKCPRNHKHKNTYEKPFVILLHQHPQLHIIFNPSTEAKTKRLYADVYEKSAGKRPLQIVYFWKSGLEQLHLSY